MTGPFLISSKLFIHFTLLSKIFFFCILFKNLLSSYKNIFFEELNLGKFLNEFKRIFVKLPSPGPSSIILKYFGFPNNSQVAISQIAIISENKMEIFGDVMKSPLSPNGNLEL